jgi:hypothetical protein
MAPELIRGGREEDGPTRGAAKGGQVRLIGLQNKSEEDDKRMVQLEEQLKDARCA